VDAAENTASIWARYAPRIAHAQEEQAKEHTRAFHELMEERVGEIPAIQLTLRRYSTMEASGVFEEAGGDPQVRIMRALWLVSKEFSPANPDGKKFARRHRNIDFNYYGGELSEYLRRQFSETENKGASEGDAQAGRKASTGGNWVAGIIDTIASQYHWTEDSILDMPTVRLMAYVNQITARITGNRIQANPEADKLKQEFMDEVNKTQGKN
tara:strand:- start:1980 stop:2615 length:636 start_codon:yes stop_codon:yes gene_type:complete